MVLHKWPVTDRSCTSDQQEMLTVSSGTQKRRSVFVIPEHLLKQKPVLIASSSFLHASLLTKTLMAIVSMLNSARSGPESDIPLQC